MSIPPSETSVQVNQPVSNLGKRLRNLLIILTATVLGVVLLLSVNQQIGKPTLTALAASATPLETALQNGKPTLIEFYANWCTSCQAMAADVEAVEHQYGDIVNFVMLNVDNDKWLPEILRYRVDGIPHFVFLNASGEPMAMSVGQQPRTILAENLAALVDGTPLPAQAQVEGRTSTFRPALKATSADPRNHGGQPSV